MRILLCLHHYLNPNQGAPGVTLALGRALVQAGCIVEYFGFEQAFPGSEARGIGYSIRFPWKIASFLKRHGGRFDILDISTGDNRVWAAQGRPGGQNRQALFTRSHGLEHTVDANVRADARISSTPLSWKYPLYHGGFRLWEVAKSLQLADMNLMLNQHDLDYAVQKLGVKPERVRLIENGIPDQFLGLPIDDMQQISQPNIRIAQVGNYIARKGIAYTRKALDSVLAHHPQVGMTFLGTGCSEAQVHADFDPAVRGKITVVPHFAREELPSLLKGHQIFLFPSLSEGFSLALPEAMCCGLAPVASAIPGNIEIAKDEKNALLVPPRDSNAIEHALNWLIADPVLLHRLRQEAYKTAQHFGWTRIASDTLALYEEALQKRSAMSISVLIPTYRRPQDLCRCLTALEAQTRPTNQVLVVVRDNDGETQDFLAGYQTSLPLRRVCVDVPGVIAAMSAGLQAASGDIIALTDDDTAPYPDWLERIEAHFAADPQVGGIGGRDWLPVERGSRRVVGKIQWYGRVIGNHHLGVGTARDVDVLKGANCAYRAEPLKQIGFQTRLRGGGAQVHWELALGAAMRRAGWKLIYDPAVAMDHFVAQRFDADQNLRGTFNAEGIEDAAHNETLILLSHLPLVSKIAFLAWAFLIGTRSEPGLAQVPRLMILRNRNVRRRLKATFTGRLSGLAAFLYSGTITRRIGY